MTKQELIEILEGNYNQDIDELKEMTKDELKERLEELNDDSDMFPNGRDYDAEDEDGI